MVRPGRGALGRRLRADGPDQDPVAEGRPDEREGRERLLDPADEGEGRDAPRLELDREAGLEEEAGGTRRRAGRRCAAGTASGGSRAPSSARRSAPGRGCRSRGRPPGFRTLRHSRSIAASVGSSMCSTRSIAATASTLPSATGARVGDVGLEPAHVRDPEPRAGRLGHRDRLGCRVDADDLPGRGARGGTSRLPAPSRARGRGPSGGARRRGGRPGRARRTCAAGS